MTDTPLIRPAAPADADAIVGIWNHFIAHTSVTFTTVLKTDETVSQMIQTAPAFFVAETNNQIVGFATYGAFRSGPGYAHTAEHSILLHPDHTGHGAGTVLMNALITHARANDIHTLIAGISGDNNAAITFHRKMGFDEPVTLRGVGWKFQRTHDLVFMQKLL